MNLRHSLFEAVRSHRILLQSFLYWRTQPTVLKTLYATPGYRFVSE